MPSEFDLIARYFARETPGAELGPGDDCALLAPKAGMELAITTDMLVAGTHFFADTNPWQLGWKSAAVNLSDLAAMGATPRWITLAGSLPAPDEPWIAAFADGLFACIRRHQVDLVGGDTTRGPLNLCITAIGELPRGRALRRDRAKAGDDLWVTGTPGLAALGLMHLQQKVALSEPLKATCILALQQPTPRVEVGLTLRERGLSCAAIDISDGLLADLSHIAERSQLHAQVMLEQLPPLPHDAPEALARQCQIAGGDDYELLFTSAVAHRTEIASLAKEFNLPITRIGQFVDKDAPKAGPELVSLIDSHGQALPITRKGFDHFG